MRNFFKAPSLIRGKCLGFLILLIATGNCLAAIDCAKDYDKDFKSKIPKLEKRLVNVSGALPSEYVNDMFEYQIWVACTVLNPAVKARIETYKGNSTVNYYLESAKRLAESGGNPDDQLKIAQRFAEQTGRNIETEKLAFKHIFEKNAAAINPSCKDTDLRDKPKGHFLKTNRFQGESSWCFAITAADLISYEVGELVSASDIAFQAHENLLNNPKKMINSAGHTFQAVDIIQKRGYCLEANQPSSLDDQNLFDAYRMITEKNSQLKKQIGRLSCSRYEMAFPGLAPGALSEIVFHTQKNLLKSINEKNCNPRKNFAYDSDIFINYKHAPLESISVWNDLLDKEKPFGISYNPNILSDGRILDKAHENPKTYHASLVIARRFNKEKKVCEFLVRNTYRKGAIELDEEYTPENENYWVNAMDLVKATQQTTFISHDE